MKALLSVLPFVFLVAGCNQAPASGDPSVITARSAEWEEALNSKDIDAMVDLYAADARLMPPNGKTMTGHDAVRASFGSMMDAGLSGTLTSVETKVAGDFAYNVGTYVLKAGDDIVDTGKYMETWALGDDGQWRYTNDIWNSDMPAVAPEAEARMPMAHVLITHEVEDGARWLDAWRGKDGRRKLFRANGAGHIHTFQSADNPNLTGLVIAVNDMEALQGMLSSEEGQAAAAEDGVDLENMTLLMEAE